MASRMMRYAHAGRLAALCACLVLRACAQIRVLAPHKLASSLPSQGRIEGSTATFGAPFYGERIVGRLVYGESLRNHSHCTEEDYEIPAEIHEAEDSEFLKGGRVINIAIVRRGKCSFVTKARVAAAKGAHAVIIVDQETSTLSATDIRNVIVGDDGYGELVTIPSVLISKEEGAQLINAVKDEPMTQWQAGGRRPIGVQPPVLVELAWQVPTDHVVVMDLWMSSGSKESVKFLAEFERFRAELNDCMRFVPHYHIFSIGQPSAFYNNLCLDEKAEFCAEDPDSDGPVSGKDVLEEDVRQLCLHEVTKTQRKAESWTRLSREAESGTSGLIVEYSKEWWQYVLARGNHECDPSNPAPTKGAEQQVVDAWWTSCSYNVMQKLGIDTDKVRSCVSSSTAPKLRTERDNVAWSPTALRINGWRYSGVMDAELVTRAICAGFTHPPPACTTLLTPIDPFKRTVRQGSSVGLGSFIAALLVIVGLVMIALGFYKRALTSNLKTTLREEVMLEVQSQMSSYSPLPA